MVKIIIIILLPIKLFSQSTYDRYTQNPKIDASTSAIKKLVADTALKAQRIKDLETNQKTMQASIANMGAQISALSNRLYDSCLSIRNFINSFSLTTDTTDFKIVNKVLSLKVKPTQ